MKSLLTALGLKDDAAEADALTALNALKAKADAGAVAMNKLVDVEKVALASEAKLFVAANKAAFADPAKAEASYIANPQSIKDLVANLVKPSPAADANTARNKAGCQTPEAAAATAANKADQQFNAVRVIRDREHCSFETAWNKARLEKPELFTM